MRKLFGMVWFGASLAFAGSANAQVATPQVQRHPERLEVVDTATRIIMPSIADTGVRRLTPAATMTTFDAATLPPIEAITATTDVRAFLMPGVPRALTLAALRRVWVIDPNIRDFVGLQENDWDFNNPDTIPGFGRLASGQQFEKRVFGEANRDLRRSARTGLPRLSAIFAEEYTDRLKRTSQ